MACDLATWVTDILTSYQAKCTECGCDAVDCADHLPSNQSSMCGDGTGLITEIYAALQQAVTDCAISVGASPDPGAVPSCLTETWLSDFKDYIDDLLCNRYEYSACDDQCLTITDPIVLDTPADADYDVVLIANGHVSAWYVRGDTTSDPLTGHTYTDHQEDCPELGVDVTNHCYIACPLSPHNGVVITAAYYASLGSPSSCIVLGGVCYCSHSTVVNPESDSSGVTASSAANCEQLECCRDPEVVISTGHVNDGGHLYYYECPSYKHCRSNNSVTVYIQFRVRRTTQARLWTKIDSGSWGVAVTKTITYSDTDWSYENHSYTGLANNTTLYFKIEAINTQCTPDVTVWSSECVIENAGLMDTTLSCRMASTCDCYESMPIPFEVTTGAAGDFAYKQIKVRSRWASGSNPGAWQTFVVPSGGTWNTFLFTGEIKYGTSNRNIRLEVAPYVCECYPIADSCDEDDALCVIPNASEGDTASYYQWKPGGGCPANSMFVDRPAFISPTITDELDPCYSSTDPAGNHRASCLVPGRSYRVYATVGLCVNYIDLQFWWCNDAVALDCPDFYSGCHSSGCTPFLNKSTVLSNYDVIDWPVSGGVKYGTLDFTAPGGNRPEGGFLRILNSADGSESDDGPCFTINSGCPNICTVSGFSVSGAAGTFNYGPFSIPPGYTVQITFDPYSACDRAVYAVNGSTGSGRMRWTNCSNTSWHTGYSDTGCIGNCSCPNADSSPHGACSSDMDAVWQYYNSGSGWDTLTMTVYGACDGGSTVWDMDVTCAVGGYFGMLSGRVETPRSDAEKRFATLVAAPPPADPQEREAREKELLEMERQLSHIVQQQNAARALLRSKTIDIQPIREEVISAEVDNLEEHERAIALAKIEEAKREKEEALRVLKELQLNASEEVSGDDMKALEHVLKEIAELPVSSVSAGILRGMLERFDY